MVHSLHLLVTRPEPDAAILARDLKRRGHRPLVEPLSVFEPIEDDGTELDTAGVQALIATSRNAIRAVGLRPDIAALRDVPIHVVGPGTEDEARTAGFRRIMRGPGDARSLCEQISETADVNAGTLVHLAGETLAYDVAGDLRRLSFHVLEPVVYRMRPARALSPLTRETLAEGHLDGVILLSPATARVWLSLVTAHNLVTSLGKLRHFCLSESVARQLAGTTALIAQVADRPILHDLLVLIDRVAATSE